MFMQRIYYGGGYMKSFSYIAQDGKGKQVKGLINAENEQEFLKKVKDKGLFVKDYKESDSDNAKSIYKFNTKELSFCCRQLSAMLTSGLTLVSRSISSPNSRKTKRQELSGRISTKTFRRVNHSHRPSKCIRVRSPNSSSQW